MNREDYRARMEDPKYKDLEVTTKDDSKDYVFISYRGNSWKKVLTEIVYKLQKIYGLRVYFDKNFASETNIWIEQFQAHMDSRHCKAMLCFIDEGYCTSYATLLELMHAMNVKSNLSDKILAVNFDIDWSNLDDRHEYDTGLGKDDPDNPGYHDEKETFDHEFKLLMKNKEYEMIEEYYMVGKYWKKGNPLLYANHCARIVQILQPKNKRMFEDSEDFYRQFIVEPLRKMTDGSVFGPVQVPAEEDKSNAKKKLAGENKRKAKENKAPAETQEKVPEASVKPVVKESALTDGKPLSPDITLKEFEELCEYTDFCRALREIREQEKKQSFDYLMAALLRGCDQPAFKNVHGAENIQHQARWNYCTYAVSSKLNLEAPVCGASQFTWTSNARKAVSIAGTGKLGENSEIFSELSPEETLGSIRERFKTAESGAFKTNDNEKVLQALDAILAIDTAPFLV